MMTEGSEWTEWYKSSHSGGDGDCVRWRFGGDLVQVRDSKNPDGPILEFTHREWVAFISAASEGECDLPFN
jgi:hypothetical protein